MSSPVSNGNYQKANTDALFSESNKADIERRIKNHAIPRIVPRLDFDGFTQETLSTGERALIINKGAYTSFDVNFYTYSKSIMRVIKGNYCRNLLVRTNDTETKIFEDNFPIILMAKAKRSITKFQPIFDQDIADIHSISFKDDISDVNPLAGEKVICILSKGYFHGLYFDLTGQLQTETFNKEVGYLYRHLLYHHIYYAIEDGTIKKMILRGWFPFIQFIGNESEVLLSLFREEKYDGISNWLNKQFTNERILEFTNMWKTYSTYEKKERQISEGLNCFFNEQYVAAISTLTPLVEGIFNTYLLEKTGRGLSYKGDAISDAIVKKANEKIDGLSLLLPNQFKEYLTLHFFRHVKANASQEATRHAVSHGRAYDDAFSRERTLQIILTIDQLFFYMDK